MRYENQQPVSRPYGFTWHDWVAGSAATGELVAEPTNDEIEVRKSFYAGQSATDLIERLVTREIDVARLVARMQETTGRFNQLLGDCIEAINEHDGCMDGKIEAAAAKNLVWRPASEFDVTFSVSIPGTDYDEAERRVDALLADLTSEGVINEVTDPSGWSQTS